MLRDKLNDLARSGAKRAANSELAFASRYLQRQQAVQTDGSEDEPYESER